MDFLESQIEKFVWNQLTRIADLKPLSGNPKVTNRQQSKVEEFMDSEMCDHASKYYMRVAVDLGLSLLHKLRFNLMDMFPFGLSLLI